MLRFDKGGYLGPQFFFSLFSFFLFPLVDFFFTMAVTRTPASVFIVMGVCGSGKTSIAQELQKLLDCDYIEGDVLHPRANVDKMAAGKSVVGGQGNMGMADLLKPRSRHTSCG